MKFLLWIPVTRKCRAQPLQEPSGTVPIDPYKWLRNPCASIKEPSRTGRLAEFVSSQQFDTIIVLVIFLHIFFTIFETNWHMLHLTLNSQPFLVNIEIGFTCAYFIEIALRIAVHRSYFFCNEDSVWNTFDLVLVLLGAVDAIASLLSSDTVVSNPAFLRMLRIMRVTKKLLRLARLLKFFSELRLMLKCFVGSLHSLFWSIMLLTGFALVFSILIVQQFSMFLAVQHPHLDDGYTSKVVLYFGSVQRALFSLFQSLSGGTDWADFYHVVEKSGALNASLFVMFILIGWLSVTNIIISVFVDKAMRLAQPDVDEALLAKRKADLKNVHALKALFETLDTNHSGSLSYAELLNCLEDERTASYCELNGLDIKDAETFFRILINISGSTEVDVDDFVTGWMQLRGPATTLDLYTMQYRSQVRAKKLQKDIAQYRNEIMLLHLDHTQTACPYKEDPSQTQEIQCISGSYPHIVLPGSPRTDGGQMDDSDLEETCSVPLPSIRIKRPWSKV